MSESTKKKVEKLISELMKYDEFIELKISTPKFTRLKPYKEFLISRKAKQLINNLLEDIKIDVLVVESSDQKMIIENHSLLEWKQYKDIPKTNLVYRYDKGLGRPGFEDHIHVFAKNNQLYAINRSGTPHDGSKAKLGGKEIKFLKSIGFTPPPNGILEWITLSSDVRYTGYKLYMLFD